MNEVEATIGDRRVFVARIADNLRLRIGYDSAPEFTVGEDADEWADFVREVALLLDAMTDGGYTRE